MGKYGQNEIILKMHKKDSADTDVIAKHVVSSEQFFFWTIVTPQLVDRSEKAVFNGNIKHSHVVKA